MSGGFRKSKTRPPWTAFVLGAGAACLLAPVAKSADVDFYRDVYPLLRANCISCHNKTVTKSGLNMETPELMKKGGETGAGVVPGHSAESLVVQAAEHEEDMVMPPRRNKMKAVDLTSSELAILKAWIDQGAKSSVRKERQVVWQPLPPGVHPIYAVSMTKNGRFAACGRANQVFLYDLATRQFVTRLADSALAKDDGVGVAHRALVQSLAFSPDGKRLASGSFREVKIWRQEKTKPAFRKGDAAMGAVISALTSDGKRMISADAKGVLHVLDTATGANVRTISDVHVPEPKLLSVSPDSSEVAIYGSKGAFGVWNLEDGTQIPMKASLDGVRAMVWTRDGKAIVTAGEDKVMRVWTLPAAADAETIPPKELSGAKSEIVALEVGTDADHFYTVDKDGDVQWWSISEAKPARDFKIPGAGALRVSGDGKKLAAGCADGSVRVWDLEAGKQLIELRGGVRSNDQMAALDWESSAQGLEVSFQSAQTARIETENKALDELVKKANDTIAAVKKNLPGKQTAAEAAKAATAAAKKSADDTAALAAQAPGGKADAALEKRNKETQDKFMAAQMAESSAVAAMEASENHINDAEAEVKSIIQAKVKNGEALVAAAAATSAAKAAQAKAAAELASVKQSVGKGTARPLAVAFSADAQFLAAVFDDGTQRVWAVASGVPVEENDPAVAGPMRGAGIAFGSDGTFISCAADGTTSTVHTGSRWVLERTLGGAGNPLVDRVNAVRFSPDGKTLGTGSGEPSRSGDICLWNVETGKLVKTWKERHSDAVLSLDFSPDGKLIASGGADKIARVTEIESGKLVRVFEGHTHHVMGVAFRADGRVLASGGADGVVLIWDMLSGERKKKIEGWTKEVTSIQFIGATNQILTSAGDNQVRMVTDEGAEIRAISKLPDFMQAAASAENASVIIGGGEDSLLRVWDGTSGRELAEFGAK
jgi:WD40 repeat protein